MKTLVKFIEDSTFELVSSSEIENFSFSLKSFVKDIFHTNLLSNNKQSEVFSMKWGKSKAALTILMVGNFGKNFLIYVVY